jgi:hypothetical protein
MLHYSLTHIRWLLSLPGHNKYYSVALVRERTIPTKQPALPEYSNVYKTETKFHGLSPRTNYTYRATAACQRSDYQLFRIKGATLSA